MNQGGVQVTDLNPASAASMPRERTIEFRGSGSEYFRIWIVNLLLSIVTLGIYSAWATVRNRRYLYGSTYLMGSAFDYHARGLQVLKGRLLAVALLVTYVAAGEWLPTVQAFMVLVALPIIPWIIVKARMFQTLNTSWRNVRFGFEQAYPEAYRVLLLWPITIPFTLGLIYPYIYFRQQRFIVDNTRFGQEAFRLDSRPGFFFRLILGLAVVAIVGIIALIALFGAAIGAIQSGGAAQDGATGAMGLVMAYTLGFYAFVLALGVAFRTAVLNHVWSHARLRNSGFALALGFRRMLWITATNIVLIIATAGLFTPWAKVRMLRYRLSRMTVSVSDDDVRAIEAAAERERAATGDEVAGAFDLDVGIA